MCHYFQEGKYATRHLISFSWARKSNEISLKTDEDYHKEYAEIMKEHYETGAELKDIGKIHQNVTSTVLYDSLKLWNTFPPIMHIVDGVFTSKLKKLRKTVQKVDKDDLETQCVWSAVKDN